MAELPQIGTDLDTTELHFRVDGNIVVVYLRCPEMDSMTCFPPKKEGSLMMHPRTVQQYLKEAIEKAEQDNSTDLYELKLQLKQVEAVLLLITLEQTLGVLKHNLDNANGSAGDSKN